MIEQALRDVIGGAQLSSERMGQVIVSMMTEDVDARVCAALLAALRMRGETLDELVGAAEATRRLALPLPKAPAGAIDTCGTGGDGPNTFNISTAAALVVAAAGTPVAKHGNRRATSLCGSAEVLEALGVPLDLAPERMAVSVEVNGIGFLFARVCHPAFGAIAPLRAALPIPTLFNRLGPLVNPMRVRRQLLGVGSAEQAELALEALVRLGSERAWVVHSEDGLDEISSCAPTHVHAQVEGRRESFTIDPEKFVAGAHLDDLAGGDAAANAEIIRQVLAGAPGPARDVVVLNAGAALYVAGNPAADDLAAGVALAQRMLDSGGAQAKLEQWVGWCRTERAGAGGPA